MARSKKTRYAVVGLGWFAQVAVLPAFAHATRNSELVALFSGERTKLRRLGRKYRVSALHSYEEFDEVASSGALDAVYVALPNHLHRDYTVRAARVGAHVLCEKPMAVTEEECEDMIRATEEARVLLMIAYRLHFEAANLQAGKIARSGRLGEVRIFDSVFTNPVTDEDNIRLNPIEKGGGTLYDIGIYCINAARSIFRSEPTLVTAVFANDGKKRFRNIDEMTAAVLKFPGERLASFTSSFGGPGSSAYEIFGSKGRLRVESAYEFAAPMTHRLTIGEKTREKRFPKRDQVAPELLYFSDCIQNRKKPEPSGWEGLADVRVIRALHRSAATGRAVSLPPYEKKKRPGLRQRIDRPPVKKQELVSVDSPSGN